MPAACTHPPMANGGGAPYACYPKENGVTEGHRSVACLVNEFLSVLVISVSGSGRPAAFFLKLSTRPSGRWTCAISVASRSLASRFSAQHVRHDRPVARHRMMPRTVVPEFPRTQRPVRGSLCSMTMRPRTRPRVLPHATNSCSWRCGWRHLREGRVAVAMELRQPCWNRRTAERW